MRNRENVNRYSQEVSTGVAVNTPGDTNVAGTISLYKETLDKVDGFRKRIESVKSALTFQDDVMNQMNEILIRAKEVASQAANETNTPAVRSQMAAEIFQLRDQMAQLANSKYQGKYIYGGADDDDPPYDAQTYTNPSIAPANQRYTFDAEAGTSITRNANITDSLSVRVNTPGNQLFSSSLQALERLGRALEGYETLPAGGAPDGTGAAYTFPADFTRQTDAIQDSITLIDSARENDIMPERVDLGGRLRRLDGASAILDVSEQSAQDTLSKLQDADPTFSISALTQAQTALQASLSVTARVLNVSILDYV